ncbi:TPA: hypothetical protein HA265_01435 [Candidatus Woesearchaeota archaeon]|nr:hypothetical protein [Candidatus Woesearchaeota archaeon]
MDERVGNIIEALEELLGDNTVPRNIKARVETVITTLREENGEEMSIKINKALSELDDISDDSNIQPFTRTQIWNIASMLEML